MRASSHKHREEVASEVLRGQKADVVNLKGGSTQGFQGVGIAVQLLQSLLIVLRPGKTLWVRETGRETTRVQTSLQPEGRRGKHPSPPAPTTNGSHLLLTAPSMGQFCAVG
ncbi:hypothetical protein llap_6502 [Limosa lapponica baueri]|uniref:Uncharacterized protein n=1 Tax=Limosa lapponica baueri TaxID=1758121 RepID=A0A2I0UAZ3_LIMLA|nr:hypothetical protein llap_6502 [Limosa lapponica baueri]